MKVLITNKKAHNDYDILEKLEAGIVLKGWEVKSLKSSHGSILDSFIKERDGQAILVGATIPIWKTSSYIPKESEKADRVLLLKKNEILSMSEKAKKQGSTIIPLDIISSDRGLIKITVALVKGKKKYDKRQKLKDRDIRKRIDQERKTYNF
jgi:SsrA-binding protein